MKDFKKTSASLTTITRDVYEIEKIGGTSIYEAIAIMAKRANQLSVALKDELKHKLEEFASVNDNLEEIHENREQIEISKFYERLPKPSLMAIDDFLKEKIYFRKAEQETNNEE
ncbi:MAG: DNA-directed RNA polymerase subunit omega [Bacteroidales bacterium]|nr:DNA-directed RNA polymerase subunit omega [Bacteroidales bacterium]